VPTFVGGYTDTRINIAEYNGRGGTQAMDPTINARLDLPRHSIRPKAGPHRTSTDSPFKQEAPSAPRAGDETGQADTQADI
jgi:hypothetical protein